jgi:hypothetical protein
MGCFDYECECGGTKCVYVGSQNGGDSDVIIEVPLNDDTTVYIKGHYNSYGAVLVGEYTFYPEQFDEYFEGWLCQESDMARSKIFLAKRIWTILYHESDEYEKPKVKASNCCPLDVSVYIKIGKTLIEKCIRADKDLNLPSDDEKQKKRIEILKIQCDILRKELGRSGRP